MINTLLTFGMGLFFTISIQTDRESSLQVVAAICFLVCLVSYIDQVKKA